MRSFFVPAVLIAMLAGMAADTTSTNAVVVRNARDLIGRMARDNGFRALS